MKLLLWSAITGGIFFASRRLFLITKNSLLHPVLWTTASLIALLEITGHAYADYARETDWMVWFLGPAVVALAVPVYRLRAILGAHAFPILITALCATLFSLLSVYGALMAFPLDRMVVKSLALKSITAPVAFEIARETGLLPALAGVGVMFAGLLGAILGPWVLKMGRVRDPRAVGLALGCTSHGVGTARSLELGETQGAFASLGMSCSAIVASFFYPLLLIHLLK